MIREKETEAIEGMAFWKEVGQTQGTRRKLTLVEHVIKEIWEEIIDERLEQIPYEVRNRVSLSRRSALGIKTTLNDGNEYKPGSKKEPKYMREARERGEG